MRTWNEYKEELATILNTEDVQERHERIRKCLRELNEFSLNNEPPSKEEIAELLKMKYADLEQCPHAKENLIPVIFMKMVLTNKKFVSKSMLLNPEWDTFVDIWYPLLPGAS